MAIAAVIGGVATVGAAGISGLAANNASNAATKAADANRALETQQFDATKANIQPFVDRGNSAGDLESAFLGIGGDPAASKAALDTYLNSTGYQFQLDQGTKAITQNKATAGLLNSGSTLKSLNSFGQNVASTYGQNFVSNLDNISRTGAGAASSLGTTGANFANSMAANNNTEAATIANSGLATAGSLTGAITNALSAYGTYRGLSSYGGAGGVPNSMSAPQVSI